VLLVEDFYFKSGAIALATENLGQSYFDHLFVQ